LPIDCEAAPQDLISQHCLAFTSGFLVVCLP
jgi:hypothetical protein